MRSAVVVDAHDPTIGISNRWLRISPNKPDPRKTAKSKELVISAERFHDSAA
jgi:hypothetical protein